MHTTRAVQLLSLAVLCMAGAVTCGSYVAPDNVDVTVDVTIPPEMRAIDAGLLRITLWTAGEDVPDARATLAGSDSLRFMHVRGRGDSFRLRVRGRVKERYYLDVSGYEPDARCLRYILWDGREQPGVPSAVTMRLVTPSCDR